MRGLKGLLIRKMVFTAVFWCLPLLFFPASWFRALGAVAPDPLVFARLLGVAYLALLVGYYGGLQSIKKGEVPFQALHMGIASNGMAAALLIYFGLTGAWSGWGQGATIFMWVSAVGALSIAASLIRFRRRYGSPVAV